MDLEPADRCEESAHPWAWEDKDPATGDHSEDNEGDVGETKELPSVSVEKSASCFCCPILPLIDLHKRLKINLFLSITLFGTELLLLIRKQRLSDHNSVGPQIEMNLNPKWCALNLKSKGEEIVTGCPGPPWPNVYAGEFQRQEEQRRQVWIGKVSVYHVGLWKGKEVHSEKKDEYLRFCSSVWVLL